MTHDELENQVLRDHIRFARRRAVDMACALDALWGRRLTRELVDDMKGVLQEICRGGDASMDSHTYIRI